VELAAHEVRVLAQLDHLGIRGVETNDAIFEDVEVGEDAILGGPQMWNQGWRQLAGRALEVEKLELSAVALGLAEAACEDAIDYASTRVQFGKPIGAHQAIRHAIAEAKTRTLAMRLILYNAAQLVQDRKPSALESSMSKLYCCEGAADVTMACQRIMGAYGLSDLMDMERYVRDAISLPLVGGSSNMQKNNIANRLKIAE
jgi:alkylation response protein AidB-like acyl-CoA dehydrogenase